MISWAITFVAALWILGPRLGMLSFTLPRPRAVLASWRAILYVGLPAAATYLLVPVANGVLTRFVSGYGPEQVAGFGVGGRVESLALIAMMALATGLAPFVGQNFGAGRCDRIREALRLGIRFSLVWGIAMAALLAVLGPTIGGWFSTDPAVVLTAEHYLWLVPVSYGAFGVAMQVNTTFNALNRPLRSAALIIIRLFVLALPLAWLGGELWGVEGIFGGLSLGNLVAGLVAYAFVFRFLRTAEEDGAADGAAEPAAASG